MMLKYKKHFSVTKSSFMLKYLFNGPLSQDLTYACSAYCGTKSRQKHYT